IAFLAEDGFQCPHAQLHLRQFGAAMMAFVIVFVVVRHPALLPSVPPSAQHYSMREGLPSAPAEGVRADLVLRNCSMSRCRADRGGAQLLRTTRAEAGRYFAGAVVVASVA